MGTQFRRLERFSLVCRWVVGLLLILCGWWLFWLSVHAGEKAETIYLVWAGVCLNLFGISYGWMPKLKVLAICILAPLAVIAVVHAAERYWAYRSTMYGWIYRNELILWLVILALIPFYMRRNDKHNDRDRDR